MTQNQLVHSFRGSNVVVYAIPAGIYNEIDRFEGELTFSPGIQLPNDLVLVYEHSDHYSLQAAKEMSLQGMVHYEPQCPTML